MTAKERYRLALAVQAKVGLTGDLYGELAKAMTLYDQVKSIKDKMVSAPPIPPSNPPTQQPLPMEGEVPEMGTEAPQEGMPPMV